jgi:hypothetical protein
MRQFIRRFRTAWAFASGKNQLIYGVLDGKEVNLPLRDLERQIHWGFAADQISLRETYTLRGKVVKDGVDIYKLPEGMVFNLSQGHLNQPRTD